MFRFYLDDVLVNNPINWSDFTETIERVDNIKGLLLKYDIKLNFESDGYDYLYSKLKSSGFCYLVKIRIEIACSGLNYDTVLDGLIFISDCTFRINKGVVECVVTDNNYGARINNNKSLNAKVDVGYSKNGVAITPATQTTIAIYNTANSFILNRKCYHVKELFRFLIAFMTDGEMDFESNFLTENTLEPAGWLFFILGQELRINDGSIPEMSFETLFSEINKKHPISFVIIKNASGRLAMKIENDDFFFSNSPATTLNNINDLELSFNTEILYSKISLGGKTADLNASLGHFPIIRFFSFSNEEYQLQGECNIDRTLDLVGTFIADSNIIERITYTDTSNKDYDSDIIFIESSDSISIRVYQSLVTLTTPIYYNGSLTNNKVSDRYSLSNNIAYYLGNNSETFMATKTTNENLNALTYNYYSIPIIFEDDTVAPNYNTTGAYSHTTGRYTASADGVYGFECELFFYIVSVVFPDSYTYGVSYKVFDSGGTLTATYDCAQITNNLSSGIYSVVGNNTINVLATQYVTAHLYINISSGSGRASSLYVFPHSYFKTTTVQNGGGVYDYKQPNNYYINKLIFTRALSYSSYNIIKSDLSNSIEINTDIADPATYRRAWIRKITRKIATGETNFELRSNALNS